MKPAVPSYPSGRGGREIKQLIVDNMSGGLNLTANPFQLKDNESPAMTDVDLQTLGGVRRRRAILKLGATIPTAATWDGTWVYTQSTGSQNRMFAYRSGANTVIANVSTPTVPLTTLSAAPVRQITMNSLNYMAVGHSNPIQRYDGTNVTTLNGNRYDDPNSLPHGSFPRCKVVAIHQGSAWAGNIYEDGVANPNQVRWSWPNQPEDWPTWATETLDQGRDSDEITAMVSHNERLLIFKKNAIYAVHGQGPTGFRIVPISQTIGAISQESVTKTDTDVYFFAWPGGLYRLGASGPPTPVFDRLLPIVKNRLVPSAAKDFISVSWINRRVYVSVPWTASVHGTSRNGRTFIYDPALDGWTAHTYGMTQAVEVVPSNQNNYPMCAVAHTNLTGIYTLCQLDQDGDSDFTTDTIYGSYQFSWLDGGDPMILKRFRRLGLIVNTTALMQVDSLFDYETSPRSTHTIQPAPVGSTVWNNNWGTVLVWSESSPPQTRIKDGRTAGRGKTISAVVKNVSSGAWELSAMALKFIPRKRRD